MPTTMKAVRIEQHGGPEVMQLVDMPVPEPGRGRVRVRVEACGLNYSDIMIRGGQYLDRTQLPYILGREFCGKIDALGPEVQGWTVGQRVVGTAPGGALAEYVVAAAAGLVPCPEGLSAAEGASFLVQGITALHCLEDLAKVEAGETVLIHAAAGGVGTLAVQIARAHKANVLGTASSDSKCDVIRSLGATAFRYDQGDWVQTFRQLTDGWGAHVLLESVGGETFRRSFLEALAPFGRMVVYGVASGQHATLTNVEVLASNKTLMGYFLGSYYPQHADKVVSATMRLVQLLREGAVKPIVGREFALRDAVAAFDHLQSRASVGKVVVTP